MADYLVEKGATSNLRNKKGRTAYEMEGMEDPDADVTVNDSSPNQIRGGGRSWNQTICRATVCDLYVSFDIVCLFWYVSCMSLLICDEGKLQHTATHADVNDSPPNQIRGGGRCWNERWNQIIVLNVNVRLETL